MSIEVKERGPDVAYMCIYLVGGCAFAYWLDFGFTRMDNQLSWVSKRLCLLLLWETLLISSTEISNRLPGSFRRSIKYRYIPSSGYSTLVSCTRPH